jgi:hypothetical protein
MSTVACMVTGSALSAERCVEEQKLNRCYCPKAVMAIVAVREANLAGSEIPAIEAAKRKERETLETLIARADDFRRKPAGDRYGGPALRIVAGAVAPALFPGDLPAAPRATAAAPEQKIEASSPAPMNAAGATRMETSNDSVRQPAPIGSARISPSGRVETPFGGRQQDARAALGVAPTRRPMPPPQTASAQANQKPFLTSNQKRAAEREEKRLDRPAPKVCSGAGCGASLGALNRSGQCQRCKSGIRPGGGYAPCATEHCPTKVQKHTGNSQCGLCRQGLTKHLRPPRAAAQETQMPTPRSNSSPQATSDIDPKSMTDEQLHACAYELRARFARHSKAARAAELALAGEPLDRQPDQKQVGA